MQIGWFRKLKDIEALKDTYQCVDLRPFKEMRILMSCLAAEASIWTELVQLPFHGFCSHFNEFLNDPRTRQMEKKKVFSFLEARKISQLFIGNV